MSDIRGYQSAFNGGVIAPSLLSRVDLAKYAAGLKTGRNVFVHAHGGVSNFAGTQFVGATKTHSRKSRLIPFQFNSDQTYVIEAGHLYMRFYMNGGQVVSGSAAYEITTPYTEDQVRDLTFVQEADVMYLAHPMHAPRKLSRLGHTNWTLAALTFGPKISYPATVTPSALVSTAGEVGYVATSYYYRVSAVSDAGEESLASPLVMVVNDLSIAGGKNRVTFSAVSGAEYYVIYKREGSSTYGVIGTTTGLVFDDENITPDISTGPQLARNPFSGAGNYPRAVAFIEQRLAYASTINEPQAVWMSQSASYENFNTSFPIRASDAITFRIKSRRVEEIRALLQTKGMMAFSSEAEWLVTGGTNSDAITPATIKIDNQGYRGSGKVQPIVVGDVVLFAQVRGGVIRDFNFDLSRDGYTGRDLTILARHYFRDRDVVAWAYAQAPDSIIYVVLNDGTVKALTYMQEHEVWAWTERVTTNGEFEDVIVVPEDGEDVPYFIVKRMIGGQVRRYIERQHTRRIATVKDAFFVDSGLSYAGDPVSSVSGLSHLNGQSVSALIDGNAVGGLTVSGGSVALPYAGSVVHVGLPLESWIETLPIDLGQVQGLGTVQGRKKSIAKVTLRVEDTRGVFVAKQNGPRDAMIEYKQRSNEAWGDPISLFTGDLAIVPTWSWTDDGCMVIKQFDPLPMTILAFMPDVTIGG